MLTLEEAIHKMESWSDQSLRNQMLYNKLYHGLDQVVKAAHLKLEEYGFKGLDSARPNLTPCSNGKGEVYWRIDLDSMQGHFVADTIPEVVLRAEADVEVILKEQREVLSRMRLAIEAMKYEEE